VGGFDYSCAIPDVSEKKGERDGADRPILPPVRRFFGRGVSEIHPGTLAGREPVALDAGHRILGGRVPGEDGDAALKLHMNILRKLALHRLGKMKMEKKRVSAKRHMMHTALDSEFLYKALFSE
jgi:hypothetical protein